MRGPNILINFYYWNQLDGLNCQIIIFNLIYKCMRNFFILHFFSTSLKNIIKNTSELRWHQFDDINVKKIVWSRWDTGLEVNIIRRSFLDH
jgi:hypothetical protein